MKVKSFFHIKQKFWTWSAL